jgi:EAL domain-containing protein (putative c-di-GMP-specific phosphodiesterase class I)/GGDEF domain-containing protein
VPVDALNADVVAQLVSFVELTADFVGVSDPWGRILYLNPAAQKVLGVADYSGLTVADLFPGDAFRQYYDVVRPQLLRTGAWSGEVLMNMPGVGAVPMYVSTTARIGPGGETNGGVVYVHAVPRDRSPTTDRSRVDTATGVLARAAFEERITSAITASRGDAEMCALIVVEADGSTAVEAMHGLANRMNTMARTIDTVGRLGERQLGLLVCGVRGNSEVFRIARMIYDSLSGAPVATPLGDVQPRLNWGAAVAGPGDDAVTLIERAAEASRDAAPHADSGEAARSLPERPGESVTLAEFRVALSHGYVQPYAQPVVEVVSETVVGYRGVSRWHHKRLGVLHAAAFIDMIAGTPLAAQVDLYLARESAAVLTLVTRDVPLRLYTPVSARLLEDVRAEQYLLEIADAFFLTPEQIRLEVPRAVIESAPPALRNAVRELGGVGIGLVLTDVERATDIVGVADAEFGEIFLSRRLTDAISAEARHDIAQVVRAAHDRGMIVGATGVRSPHQHDTLIDTGCRIACGELYGRFEPCATID